jgi:hypothetical protein
MRAGASVAATMIVGLAIVVPSGAVSPPRQGLYYVDPEGSDSTGTGTRADPWRSIAKACASTPAGVGNTIRINAGSYEESVTCRLRCKTNLRGAGSARTSVKGSADPLILVKGCTHPRNAQTITGLKLDGQDRSAGVHGLRALRVRGLTITRIVAEGFRGPPDAGGGAIDISEAWKLDLGRSTLRNSGNANARACSGTLGLGDIHDSKVHHLRISDDRAYGVKTSTHGVAVPSEMTNVEFSNLTVHAASERCARWNTLAFELYRTEAVNVTIRNSRFNRVLSLVSQGAPLKRGFRFHVHNNIFSMESDGDPYSIELYTNSSLVHHNYFDGGLYPIADFTKQPRANNTIHHNVFDNQIGPTAAMHMTGGVRNARFYNNTIVLRRPSWRDGVFSLGEAVGYAGGTSDIRNNLFVSTFSIGDKLGLGLGASRIDSNGFHNIAGRGRNAITADPRLPLVGGFPNAYIPPPDSVAIDGGVVIPSITDGYRGNAPDLGAFDGGRWPVGPD